MRKRNGKKKEEKEQNQTKIEKKKWNRTIRFWGTRRWKSAADAGRRRRPPPAASPVLALAVKKKNKTKKKKQKYFPVRVSPRVDVGFLSRIALELRPRLRANRSFDAKVFSIWDRDPTRRWFSMMMINDRWWWWLIESGWRIRTTRS